VVSNIVLVYKKDVALRYCIHYRGLNAVTTKANYPGIEACHDSLGGNTYFSSLDIRSRYWQVPAREQDIDKTCFVTRKGIFGFKVLLSVIRPVLNTVLLFGITLSQSRQVNIIPKVPLPQKNCKILVFGGFMLGWV